MGGTGPLGNMSYIAEKSPNTVLDNLFSRNKKGHDLSLTDFTLHWEIILYSKENINLFRFIVSHFGVKIFPCP